MTQHESEILKAVKGARLMLYAWRGVRQRDGLGCHPELDRTIAELEYAISLMQAPINSVNQ